jgi:Spy/CpxP family protein refolding chaperone
MIPMKKTLSILAAVAVALTMTATTFAAHGGHVGGRHGGSGGGGRMGGYCQSQTYNQHQHYYTDANGDGVCDNYGSGSCRHVTY